MMKRIFGLMIAMALAVTLYAQEEKATEIVPGPAITFEEDTHDFGDINQGDKVEHTFAFENTGDEPLIITNVRVTCGCTATKWPREPLAPGEKRTLTVQFNSAGKKGRQNKVITVISNAVSPMNQVSIVTNVLIKESDTE